MSSFRIIPSGDFTQEQLEKLGACLQPMMTPDVSFEVERPMTDDQALAILQDPNGGGAWIVWSNETNRPHWGHDGCVKIDGHVTADELRALLHFAPKGSGEA